MLQEVRAGAEAGHAGHREVVTRLFVPFPGDDEAAIDQVRDVIADYASAPVYRRLLERIGYARQVEQSLTARADRDRAGARRAIDDTMVESLAILGSPDEQKARVAEYVRAGTDVPVLAFFHGVGSDDDRRARTAEATVALAPRPEAASP